MAFYSTVDCWEVDNTASFGQDLNGTSASVTLGCAFANINALYVDLLANRRTWPGTTGTGAPRVSSIESTGHGLLGQQPGSPQLLNYEEGRLVVNYEPLAAQIPNNPAEDGYDLIVETIEGQVDGKRLDFNNFVWSTSGALNPGESPVKQVRHAKITREFFGWATVPDSILDLVGACNSAPFTDVILGRTFAAETLLLHHPYQTRTIRTDGSEGWNVKITMGYKPSGWNTFWKAESSSYERFLSKQSDGSTAAYDNYPPQDFSAFLF